MPNDALDLSSFNWQEFASHWKFPNGVHYLNHGSFGPAPRSVREMRESWYGKLEDEPMDFYVRQLETLLDEAAAQLGRFINAPGDDLLFVTNATTGMNYVADSFDLQPGDQVLLNDHEYGAVMRIWQYRCETAKADCVIAKLPRPLETAEQLVDGLFAAVTPRTKLIVISHVTSQTATIFPVQQVCARAREHGIQVCIDGPHAVAMVPLDMHAIGCDYYTASCHKWLCAPLGTGFLYVRPEHQSRLRPAIRSWGRSLSGRPGCWKDEFHWSGTYDPSGYLSIPTAIDFLENTVGIQRFRDQTHALARYARQKLVAATDGAALIPDEASWYGPMVTVTLPRITTSPAFPGQMHPLQVYLWDRYRIEAPVFQWTDQLCIRASCHMYTQPSEIDLLADAVVDYQQHHAT